MGLCGMISFQLIREAHLRREVEQLTNTVQDKSELALNHEATIRRHESEIQRFENLKKDLTETVKSNATALAAVQRTYERATNEVDRWQKQSEIFNEALARANENIQKQNEDIRKQNEDLKKVAADRNELVRTFNKMANDYNELVGKWNKQQEGLAKRATNSPATASKK
jgi:chromosome segregation ATPase